MLRAFALSPLRIGALRSAWKYPLCSGGGCQATTHLTRSGLSHRNAASSKGHFLWVTFLLGQQKKSDSAAGRPSKRPLRKRPVRHHLRSQRKVTRPPTGSRNAYRVSGTLAEKPRRRDTAKTNERGAGSLPVQGWRSKAKAQREREKNTRTRATTGEKHHKSQSKNNQRRHPYPSIPS